MALDFRHYEEALKQISEDKCAAFTDELNAPQFTGYIKSCSDLSGKCASTLLPLAKEFSVAPLSGFKVGAIAIGASGHLYLGANMEFAGVPLSCSLHAEQSAILNAWMHAEPSIEALVVSELPCGHCRQFLRELSCAENLKIHVDDSTFLLSDLLPSPFGEARKLGDGLLDSEPVPLNAIHPVDSDLTQRVINAAERSYTPYTEAHAGFIIECDDGRIHAGRAAESIAFNPSVMAVVCALNSRNLSPSRDYTISHCMQTKLVTSVNSQSGLAEGLMQNITTAQIANVLIEPA